MKIIVATVLSLTLTVIFPVILQPYVLQGPHIIQLMTDKLGQANSLFISQDVIFYNVQPQPDIVDEENSGGAADDTDDHLIEQPAVSDEIAPAPVEPAPIQLEESVSYVFSQAFRSDIISDTNQRIHVYNRGQALTVIDGMIANFSESRFDLYKDLLLYRSRPTLSKRLVNLGIDVTVSSLGKFNDRLALVVGAEFPDETVPQVWVDKETLQPFRLIIPSGRDNGTGILEIRYTVWREIGKMWYPMRIEFVQDGMTVRKAEVKNYQINPNFSKELFDIARLISEYRQTVQTTGQPGKNEDLSEVQKTIEEFKKIFD